MSSEREFAINLAKKAGAIMRKNFTLGMKKEWKQDRSPLTVTDTTINRMVIQAVAKTFPEHSVLGEEESNMKEGDEYVWVCDPVDGTIPFSHGIPISCFLLALTHNGIVELGVLYNPFLDELFVAEKGKGATMNGAPIHVSPDRELVDHLVEAESWLQAAYHIWGLHDRLHMENVIVTAYACVGFSGSRVALGEMVGLIFPASTPWDGAALKIIIEEAGGKVTDLYGNDQRYDRPTKGFLGTNGLVHDALLEHIQAVIEEKE